MGLDERRPESPSGEEAPEENPAEGSYHPTPWISVLGLAALLGRVPLDRRGKLRSADPREWRTLHEETVLRDIRDGKLPASRQGRDYRISRDDAYAYILASMAMPKRIPKRRRPGRPRRGRSRVPE